jgi:hypothetical protein
MSLYPRTIAILMLALIVAACASHRARVDCEGKLKPINAPASAKSASPRP